MSTRPTPLPNEAAMSWLDHARELRNRLLKASLAVVAGLIAGIVLVQYNDFAVLNFLIAHFNLQGQLISIAIGEKFTNAVQIALGMGIAMAMPVIMYQLLAFIVPGLTRKERRILLLVLPFIILCFFGGLLFGWFITVPAAISWLLDFASNSIRATPTFDEFSSFFVRLMLINGVVFELPIVVYTLIWLGAVQRTTLTKYRRFAVLIIVVVAAVVTPTGDPINLALAAVPMYLLYELGLLLALLAPRKRTA